MKTRITGGEEFRIIVNAAFTKIWNISTNRWNALRTLNIEDLKVGIVKNNKCPYTLSNFNMINGDLDDFIYFLNKNQVSNTTLKTFMNETPCIRNIIFINDSFFKLI